MADEKDVTPPPFGAADLSWEIGPDDQSAPTPRSRQFDDIYFSGDGPAETTHVFLNGVDLETRIKSTARCAIAELGFGTGLNLLMAWQLWEATAKHAGACFDYFSIEKYPLTNEELKRAHANWPALGSLAAPLRQALPPNTPGFHRLQLAPQFFCTLFYGDVRDGLQQVEGQFDGWFLDGFSPTKNPEMWQPSLFKNIARLSKQGANLATFTVAGAVRRGLQDAGFSIEKRPGFGRKRDMLTATLKEACPPVIKARPAQKPWFQSTNTLNIPTAGRVAIIGGGIAGASIAFSLKQRGITPVVFDPTVASGASGNPAGLIMPRLDLGDAGSSRFFLQAYHHAISLLTKLNAGNVAPFFSVCGGALKASSDEDLRKYQKIVDQKLLPQGWVEQTKDGLFFPQAGVVDPISYVNHLLGDTKIIPKKVVFIGHDNDGNYIKTQTGEKHSFAAVVIANSVDALLFSEARTLPLEAIAGQLDFFPNAPAPSVATIGGPYTAPGPDGGLVIGATYQRLPSGQIPTTSTDATLDNIAVTEWLLAPGHDPLKASESEPRASLRCQTPDQMPIVGPLPDWRYYAGAYDGIRQGKPVDYPLGLMRRGIFILSSLGSRGLVTAPLCAELIASALSGALSPVARDVREALHPARFFIRDLKRTKPRQ